MSASDELEARFLRDKLKEKSDLLDLAIRAMSEACIDEAHAVPILKKFFSDNIEKIKNERAKSEAATEQPV